MVGYIVPRTGLKNIPAHIYQTDSADFTFSNYRTIFRAEMVTYSVVKR